MLNLTNKESEMVSAFVQAGIDINGATEATHLIEDNMTYCNANDLHEDLGWNKQEIGGVMSSLLDKCMICDTEDSARGAKVNDFVASDEAIHFYFDNIAD